MRIKFLDRTVNLGTLLQKRGLWRPPGRKLAAADLFDPRDPNVLGFDRLDHQGLSVVTEESDVLDYVSAGSDAVKLSRDRVITCIVIVANPYRHDVTTATITPVQDAVDKIISALTISGRTTYFALSNATLYLKGIRAQNQLVYAGGIPHEDLATGVGADNDSFQAWIINFGPMNDYSPYDILAGIPAEDENALNLSATFGANNIIATTAANGTVDTATDLYVITFGVQGLPPEYRARMPKPDFKFSHHLATIASTVREELQSSRFLKRTTIVTLDAVASNNEARSDAEVDRFSIEFKKPTTTKLMDRIRWRNFRNGVVSPFVRQPLVDNDGSSAVLPTGLIGVAQIDWRKYTGNPYGMNLYPTTQGDVAAVLEMTNTDGSLHFYHEYYQAPDPTVFEGWPSLRPQ